MFKKDDAGKPRLSLLVPAFVVGVAEVATFGAKNYGVENWKSCDDTNRYKDALLRHIYAYLGGEKNDPESGKSHLLHASCNLMFLFWFDLKPVKHQKDIIQHKVLHDDC